MAKNKVTFNISKLNNFSEWYSEILQRAEVTDIRYGVKGFVVIRPWGAKIIEKMYKIYESALARTGHEPSFFPTVIPEENFKKEAGHVEGFSPQVFWLENLQGEEKIALRPTSETAFYQMYNLWIRSYRDLPLKIYQRANVFRYETKATRPLIRSREFYWIEAHNCFANRKEAEAQVLEDISMTEAVMHNVFGVPFVGLKRPEWDKFAGAEYTIGSDSILPDGKLIQQPSTHLLGQNFSRAFDVRFKDSNEEEDYVWQTCYGPAISRILASVISVHGDDSGLVLPYTVSPIQVVIVPMYDKEKNKEINIFAQNLNNCLFSERIDSLVDNSEKRPGEKFFYYEMKGVPFRVELGKKELESGKLTVFVRDIKEKVEVKADDLVNEIKRLGILYDARLKKKADLFFNERIVFCKDKGEFRKALEKGKIAKINFCSIDKSGEGCAGVIEKEFLGEVRGERFDVKEKPDGKCLFCGKKAKSVVYVGRSY
jgi:prolyl-tRNA synthetase